MKRVTVRSLCAIASLVYAVLCKTIALSGPSHVQKLLGRRLATTMKSPKPRLMEELFVRGGNAQVV